MSARCFHRRGIEFPKRRSRRRNNIRGAFHAGPSDRRLRLEPLEYRLLLSSGPLWISEFMANNTKTLKDQDGAYSDWLEIDNPGTAPVNLGGWSLTDSATNLKMWQFPSEDLQAGQYLVVFASGKDRAVAGSELHTNFTLTPSGGYLALVEPDGKTITDAYSPQYPAQVADISYGWSQDLTTQGYFTSPSPGMANIGQPIPNVAQQVIVNELMYHPGFGDPGYPGYVAEDTMKQWVELYNKGTTAVNLSNWQLTQGAKYTFPSGTSIAAGGYLVVAADPATFHATYPSVSNYVGGVTLVAPAATAEALVPTSAALGTTWTGINFTETGWTSGTTGVGYQQDTTYQGLIGLNVGTAMYTHNTSVYARVPFTVSDPSSFTTLHLRMKYDDGFVAYLNGVQVASVNAPASPSWNSAATGEHLDDQAVLYEDFDISANLSALVSGTNVLAIQAMDTGASDAHMLISPELVANCWGGKLGAGGDTVTLNNAVGQVVNSVSYTNDGDWAQRRLDAGYGAGGTQPTSQPTWWKGWEYTTGADAGGKSLELIDPNLPNQYGENWTASVPDGGTPGAANSVLAADAAPLIENVSHFPVVPSSIETVTVTATLTDELLSGVTATLYYRADSAKYATITFNSTTGRATVALTSHGYANGDSVTISGADQGAYDGTFTVSNATTNTFDITINTAVWGNPATPATGQILVGKPFIAAPMYDDGLHGDGIAGDGVFGATVPAMADKTVVEFYVQSRDTAGHTRTWPAPTDNFGGQGANALYQVDNMPQVNHTDQPLYLIITTAAQWNAWNNLLTTTNGSYNGAYADSQFNATWISIDGTGTEVHYGCGVRNRGSGSRVRSPHNLHVNIPSDHLWEHYSQVELNTQYTESQTVGNAVFSMAGLYNTYGTPVQLNVNGTNLAGTGSPQFGSYYRFLSYSSEWTSTHTPDDSNGDMYWGMHAFDNVSLGNGATLSNLGTNVTSYQQVYSASGPYSSAACYQKKTNATQNDWSDLVNLVTVLNATYTSDDAYYQAVSKVVNIDQWVKFFAVNSLLNNNEAGLSNGTGDDYYLFSGMLDPRFQLVNHDMDTVLGEGDTINGYSSLSLFASCGVAAINKFLRNSEIVPKFYAALQQYATTIFSAAEINPLIDQLLGSWVPSSTIQNMKTFAANRAAWVLSQIPTSLTAASPETVQSGYPHTTNSTTSLTGKFNVMTTASIKVNGVLLPISDSTSTPSAPYMRPWAGDWAAASLPLNPGINRFVVQAFDAGGDEIDRTTIDVWRDTGSVTTVAGGTLAANTNWTAAGGPYSVTGSLTIPSGVTLNIGPGTSVYMASGANLTVANGGILTAQGTDTQRIMIIRAPGSSSNWGGITVNGGVGSPQTTISYANIAYNGTTAIESAGGTVFLDHLTFGTNQYQYVSLDSSSFVVQDCEFPAPGQAFEPGHGTGGIKSGGRGLFLRNYFGGTNNYNDVVDFTGGNRPGGPIVEFIDNVIMGMSDDGWDLDGTDAWVQGNIFLHAHKNGSTPDSSSGVSSGGDSGNTSEITIIDNIFYDDDQAAQVKDGGFFTLLNNTIVHQSHTGGIDTTGAVVCASDDSNQSLGIYLQGNIVWDAENLVRNQTTSQITFNDNLMSLAWSGPGTGNTMDNPGFEYVPQVSETSATNFTDWQQAQIMRQWFSLTQGSPAIGSGPERRRPGRRHDGGCLRLGSARRRDSPEQRHAHRRHQRHRLRHPHGRLSQWLRLRCLQVSAGRRSLECRDAHRHAHLAHRPGQRAARGGRHRQERRGVLSERPGAGPDAVITHSATWTVNTALAPHMRINEVLADNVTAVPYGTAPNVTYPDVAELYNDGQGTKDLSDMSLSDNPASPRKFVFAAGTTLAQGQYLVLYGGTDATSPANHLGFAFGTNGDSLYLYNSLANGGGAVDSVTFGMQLPDRSIGRLADGTWGLTTPTFGAVNVALPTAAPSKMKINEWLASENVTSANNFVELYNGDTLPVNMGGMYLTDNPEDLPEEVYLGQQDPAMVTPPLAIPPLSFIDGATIDANGLDHGAYAVFKADAALSQGANHLAFKLRPFEGLIGLFDDNLNKIDQIFYGPQTTDVSEGRNPLGDSTYSTETIPTPGIENTGTTNIGGSTNTTTTHPIASYAQSWTYYYLSLDATNGGWTAPTYNDSTWASGPGR